MAAPAGVGIVLYVFCVLRVSNTTLGAESALSRCSLLMNTGESRDFGFVFAVDVGGTDLSSTLTSPDALPGWVWTRSQSRSPVWVAGMERLEPSCWPVGAVQQQGAWVGSQSSLPSRASHTCLNCSAEGQLCLTEPSPQGLSQELHLELHTGVLQKVIGKQNSCKGKFLLVQKCLKSTRGSYRCSVCFVAYIIRELFEDVFQAWDSKTIFFKETLSFHYNFA